MKNSKTTNLKYIFYIIVFVLIAYIGCLHYINYNYERQIEDNNRIIQKLIVQDSIANSILPLQKKDDSTFFIVSKNIETGKILTYKDLDSLYLYYREKSDIYETLLLSAKRNYKFNYSYQVKGDTLIMSFWDK